MSLSAVIIDDEALALEHLKAKLAKLWPELNILGTAVNGRQGLALVREVEPDIVFLDIHMPGLSGLDVADALPKACQIVFVTAFDQYAIDAFERAAADYLLKPVADERLRRAITKLQKANAQRSLDITSVLEQLTQRQDEYLTWLRTGLEDVTELVPVADVVYFQADQKYTSVYTRDHEYVIRTPLKALEDELDPEQFWRIHRGIIVRVNQIVSAKRDLRGRYNLTLRDRPERLRSSQSYGHLFKQM